MPSDGDREWVERRRAHIEIASHTLKTNRIVWFHNTVHDIPIQRPRKLANAITRFGEETHLLTH
jgi:hypothetical protein